MSGDAAADVPIGKQLYDQGWRQGSLFGASPLYLAWNDAAADGASGSFNLAHKMARAQTRFILVIQDCDLISGSEELVEALACATQSERFIARVQRNSARWFVVDPAARLVAKATQRIHVSKRALATLTPQPWPGNEERRVQFVQWLGRRYTRPAMPDAMVEAFQKPLEAALYRLADEHPVVAAAFNRVVHDLRVSIPVTEEPPYDLRLAILIRDDGLTAEEADAI